MRDYVYVVFDSRGIRRTSKRPPKLRGGEHAVKVVVLVDRSVIARMIPEAQVNVGPVNVIKPVVEPIAQEQSA